MRLVAQFRVHKRTGQAILAFSFISTAVVLGVLLPVDVYLKTIGGVFLLVAAVAAALFQIRQPYWGFSALIVSAVLIPLERGRLNFVLPLTAFVCACGAVAVFQALRNDKQSRAVYAALTLITIAAASFVVGQGPWFRTAGAPMSAQITGLAMFVLSAGLFLAVGFQVHNLEHLRQLVWLFVLAGAAICVMQTVPVFAILDRFTVPKSIGSLFWVWLVAVAASQALLNRDLPLLSRVFMGAVAGLVLFRGIVLASTWASGWLPPLVALEVVLLFRWPRATVGLTLVALPLCLYSAAAITGAMAHETYSYTTRLAAWQALGEVIERNPLLGLGPSNYYYYTPLIPILGWYVNFSSHNQYLDLIAQVGFLGFLAFGWFVVEVCRMILRLRRKVVGEFGQAYLIGALAGGAGALVAGMLADWIIPFIYNIGVKGFRSSLLFWLFLGGVLSIKRIMDQQVSRDLRRPLGLRSRPSAVQSLS